MVPTLVISGSPTPGIQTGQPSWQCVLDKLQRHVHTLAQHVMQDLAQRLLFQHARACDVGLGDSGRHATPFYKTEDPRYIDIFTISAVIFEWGARTHVQTRSKW